MKKKKQNPLERKLDEQLFEAAAKAIEGGKETGDLNNPELVEELVEKYKGKTPTAPIEVIMTSALFLNRIELLGIMEVLKCTLHIKMAEELRTKVEKGEATDSDTITSLMLAAIMEKESEED